MMFPAALRLCRAPIAGFAAIGTFWGTFAALVPDLKPQIGLSDGAFGLALLVGALGAMLAMWLAPLAQRLLGQRCLAIITTMLAFAFVLPGLATVWITLALGLLAVSMLSGTLDVVVNAEISAFEAQSQAPYMNLVHGLYSVSYAVAAMSCGLMREVGLPPTTILPIMACVALGCVLAMRGAPVAEAAVDPDDGTAPKVALALMLPAGLIILIGFMAEQATEGWSALFLERDHGAGPATGALGPALLGLTMGIGRLSGQIIVSRFSERSVILWGACLSGTGAAIAAMSPSLGVAYLGFAILGLGVSVVAPTAFAIAGRSVRPHQRAHVISRVSVIGYAGFFIGPPLMGFVAEGFGLSASFATIAVLLFLIPLVLIPRLK